MYKKSYYLWKLFLFKEFPVVLVAIVVSTLIETLYEKTIVLVKG